MRLGVSLMVLLLAGAVSALGQSKSSLLSQANPAATGPTTELSGCLQGAPQSYRLVRENGNVHLLVGDNKALASHVGDMVTLQGYRDNNRDASASSDEGTPRGMRFFQVDSIAADNGSCNVR